MPGDVAFLAFSMLARISALAESSTSLDYTKKYVLT